MKNSTVGTTEIKPVETEVTKSEKQESRDFSRGRFKKYKIINGILGCLMNALAIAAIQTIGFPLLNAFERHLSTSMAIDQMSGSAQYIDYAPMIRCGSAIMWVAQIICVLGIIAKIIDIVNYCMRPANGRGLGLAKVLDYIGVAH